MNYSIMSPSRPVSKGRRIVVDSVLCGVTGFCLFVIAVWNVSIARLFLLSEGNKDKALDMNKEVIRRNLIPFAEVIVALTILPRLCRLFLGDARWVQVLVCMASMMAFCVALKVFGGRDYLCCNGLDSDESFDSKTRYFRYLGFAGSKGMDFTKASGGDSVRMGSKSGQLKNKLLEALRWLVYVPVLPLLAVVAVADVIKAFIYVSSGFVDHLLSKFRLYRRLVGGGPAKDSESHCSSQSGEGDNCAKEREGAVVRGLLYEAFFVLSFILIFPGECKGIMLAGGAPAGRGSRAASVVDFLTDSGDEGRPSHEVHTPPPVVKAPPGKETARDSVTVEPVDRGGQEPLLAS